MNLKQTDRLKVKSNRPLTFLWTLPCALANLMSSLFLFFLFSSSFRTCSINFLKKSRSRRRFSSENVHQFNHFFSLVLNFIRNQFHLSFKMLVYGGRLTAKGHLLKALSILHELFFSSFLNLFWGNKRTPKRMVIEAFQDELVLLWKTFKMS